jgi:hypothetical protein
LPISACEFLNLERRIAMVCDFFWSIKEIVFGAGAVDFVTVFGELVQ